MTLEQQQIRQWMLDARQECPLKPTLPNATLGMFRCALIREENDELRGAFDAENIIEVADALGDLIYVVLGTAVACGIDLEPVFQEIHRSNRTKLIKDGDGNYTLTKNHLGKVLKPSTYEPPNLQPILTLQCNAPLCP